jgi:5-methylcytosine-specific restriction endonuclease McrA
MTRCRNRLWKPETKRRKNRRAAGAGDIIIKNPDGSIRQVIDPRWTAKPKAKHRTQRDEERDTEQYREWRSAVLLRDKGTCILCGEVKNVQAHHIERWADNPERRYDVKNGVAICVSCHEKHHGPHMTPFPVRITKMLKDYVERRSNG